MFCGAAARAAADLARWRWELAAGTKAAPVRDARAAWPQEIRADMRGCATAIARSVPALSGLDERRETFRLTRDALAAAKRHIYIETQYLASFDIGDVLEERLAERHGPEIAILVTSSSRGLLEQFVMAHNRDRLIRRLHDADRFGRLRAMYAVVPAADGSECEVLIHSKVLIVDDAFVRIGSSNMNNRSEAMDMECDIAVEAACADERRAIAALRERLMAEHLDTSPAAVAAAMRRGGSLTGAIDRLNRRPRGLRPFSVDPAGGTAPVPGTTLLDPKRPFSPLRRAREVIASAVSRLMPGAL
jgi:phosphatidylserine/phosphatidylglycerophosphate/cardiolipin synthase-like enzyme